MLIIRYDNGVLQPNGEFSSNVQTQEEGAGLLWWHILLIVVAGVVLAGVVILVSAHSVGPELECIYTTPEHYP